MNSNSQTKASTTIKKPRVLLVDDSRLIRAAARKMLRSNFDPVLAEDGQRGWDEITKDDSIQLVFTDLVMPVLDGFELLDRVRRSDNKRIRNLPVIVMTDVDGQREVKQRAYMMGATDFISKQFDSTDLNARVNSLLGVDSKPEPKPTRSELDPVTGLLRKQVYFNQLGKDLATNTASYQTMVVAYFEIDGFKEIFVQVGRAGAALILKKVAEAITSETRVKDSVTRFTLSGFAISMPDTQLDTATLIAKRISKNVRSLKMKIMGKALHLYLSIGACVIDQGATIEPEVVLDLAKETRTQGLKTFKISSIYLRAFREKYLQKDNKTLSMDKVLNQLRSGIKTGINERMGLILSELKPIFTLMSDEHKERLIRSLQ